MNYRKTTLKNGIRVITVPTHGNPSVTVMVMVETGSYYEPKNINGLSHFLEHMLFKGSKKRPSTMDISRDLEVMGAINNAFTSSEVTAYHAKAEKRHFKEILDIIADMYLHPLIPPLELEKERGVILQEISMYEDLPKVKVWHVLAELMYGETPAGRSVLGLKENIKRFTKRDFQKYHKAHYVAKKTVVVVAGDINEKEVVREVSKVFKEIPDNNKLHRPKVVEKQKSPAIKIEKKKSDQTHLLVGFRTFNALDKRNPALAMLSTILGSGMSSRLFMTLREEMGACYYVRTHLDSLSDHGLLAISTGINASRTEEVIEAILKECKKLAEDEVLEEELNKAKEYHLGHLYMNLETSDALADFYGEQEIVSANLKSPKQFEQEIRKVTVKDVQKVAKEIFTNGNLNLAIVGNVKGGAKLEKVFKF